MTQATHQTSPIAHANLCLLYTSTVEIDAGREGTVVFPNDPIVRVTGPIVQCQLLETQLLNCVNFETLAATKAARVCLAAETPVAEFGLRRAQGESGGMRASRACIVGGCASTSNVLAGREYGLPVSGTHAHAWVMAFDDELEAFRASVSYTHLDVYKRQEEAVAAEVAENAAE